jgi:ribosomal protein S18 acetylase RimI-like enzyme
MDSVVIAREAQLSPDEFLAILNKSGLGVRRPVHDRERMAAIIANSNLILTARDNGALIGLARCLTDFRFNCYVSDLAVDKACQGRGIGKALMQAVRAELDPRTRVYLTAAPDSVAFYERIGMERNDRAFRIIPPDQDPTP